MLAGYYGFVVPRVNSEGVPAADTATLSKRRSDRVQPC